MGIGGVGVDTGAGDERASTEDKGEDEATGGAKAGAGDGVDIAEISAFFTEDTERTLSVLSRLSIDDLAIRSTGDALLLSDGEAARPMSNAAGVFVVLTSFFPQNENSRPVGFCVGATTLGASFSRILHPTGTTSSSMTSFLPLMDFSQAVEPLLAR